MAYKDILSDVRKCIELKLPERMPVFALSEEFDCEQAGLTYDEYSQNSDNVAMVHMNAIQRFDYDWACVYIDDCLEFEPLGVQTVGSGNIPKSVSQYLPASYEILKKIGIPDPYKDGRMPILIEAIQKIRNNFDHHVMVCGRSPAPFSAATLLYGVEATLYLMYDDPELLYQTMKFCMELELDFAKAQVRAGAHALWVGDCCASSRFLSVDHFRRFVLEITTDFMTELKKLGAITIYFGAEKNVSHLLATTELKPDIIALSENADMIECRKAAGDRVCLMGNLDPIKILQDGKPATIQAEIEKLMFDNHQQGGYLFNTGEGVTRYTSSENVYALVESLRKSWGK